MQRTLTNRRQAVLLSLAMVATGFVGVQPLKAQDPAPAASTDRYRVLVPMLERKGAVRPDFGKKVAEAIAKQIGGLRTHTPVPAAEVKEALRKYKLKEEELDCIKDRQLAVQINAELVMCGVVEQGASGYTINAQFIGAKTGETFELTPVQAADPNSAAAQIYSQFEKYITQLSLARFCNDYLASQQYDKALENCNQALQVNPNSQTVNLMKGMALYRTSMSADQATVTDTAKLQQSADVYKKVIELNPINQDALRQAGIISARLGRAEESRQYFRQYMELNPGDVGVRLAIASEAVKNGDPEGALRIVEEGLKADSNSVDLLAYAGHMAIQAATKSTDRTKVSPFYEVAANYYKKVFTAKDTATDNVVLQNLILALNAAGDKQGAVDIGSRAVVARPKEVTLWSAYATALSATGKNEEALKAIESGLSIDPKFKGLAARRASILLNMGRLDAARAAFQEAITAGADADDAAQLVLNEGLERYRSQDYDQALQYFAFAKDLANDAAKKGGANFWTGMVYYQRGIPVAKPQTPKAARAALPIFERALEYFQSTGVEAYAGQTRGVNLGQTLSAVRQYIDIQKQVIKRGT
ncbi:MAG TPA: tetratricopeptide repeat protein [Longimicrobiales bacterium]|nr:tetratricopeptide repeat protein [Longimicrobiales bacterium]